MGNYKEPLEIQTTIDLEPFPPQDAWLQGASCVLPNLRERSGPTGTPSSECQVSQGHKGNIIRGGNANEQAAQTHEEPQGSQHAQAPEGPLNAPVSSPLHAAHAAAATAAARASQDPPQPPPLHILRSSALDAGRLDLELTSLLGEQLSKVFALFNPGRIMEWDAEINAVLNLLVFGASVWQSPSAATPGSALLNLKYRSEDAPGAALMPSGLLHWLARLQDLRGHHSGSSLKPSTPLNDHASHPGKSPSTLQPGSQSSTHLSSRAAVHQASPATAAASSHSHPLLESGSKRSADVLGGRTGVEGPSLSTSQRVLLVLGMVAVPYAWARMGRWLAAAAVAGGGASASSNFGIWGGRSAGAQYGSSPAAGRAHRESRSLRHSNSRDRMSGSARDGVTDRHGLDGGDDISGTSDGGVIGAALKYMGLDHLVPPVLAWLAKCRAVCREQWSTATHTVHRAWGLLDARLWWRLMRGVETVYRGAALVNFLAFLAGGKYRSLLGRVVGARLVYQQPSMARVISFEYLNRQLVWHEVSELLLLLLPLLDAARFRRGLGRLLPRLPSPASVLQRLTPNGSTEGEDTLSPATEPAHHPPPLTTPGLSAQRAEVQAAAPEVAATSGRQREDDGSRRLLEGADGMDRPKGPCPVCGTKEMLQPTVALPCRHVFCYYCLSASCMADRWYECPLDGIRVAAMTRWQS